MATNMILQFENPSVGGDIEVLSFTHGGASEKTLSFTKYLDSTTTELLKLCWSGKAIEKATLRCFRSDGSKTVEYLVISMQSITIANLAVNGRPGDVPIEEVFLEYGSIQYEYRHQLGAPPKIATYDVETGTIG